MSLTPGVPFVCRSKFRDELIRAHRYLSILGRLRDILHRRVQKKGDTGLIVPIESSLPRVASRSEVIREFCINDGNKTNLCWYHLDKGTFTYWVSFTSDLQTFYSLRLLPHDNVGVKCLSVRSLPHAHKLRKGGSRIRTSPLPFLNWYGRSGLG